MTISWGLEPLLQHRAAFIVFVPAVVIAAALAGLWLVWWRPARRRRRLDCRPVERPFVLWQLGRGRRFPDCRRRRRTEENGFSARAG